MTITEDERRARLALLERLDGCAAALRRALRRSESAAAALAAVAVRTRAPARRQVEPEPGAGETRALAPGDADWPAALDGVPDPPALLFVRGRWPTRPLLAVVGAREADEYGLAATRALARAAVDAGWAVVSGGARGVDGAAHEAALDAGGETVVVLGSGLGRPYPREHAPLFARAVATGALVSEYPAWRGPRPPHFPERNRLVAGLAAACLVTTARLRSGALVTARLARALGRPLFAVPGDLCFGLSYGTGALLAAGATAVLGPGHLAALLDAVARGQPLVGAAVPPDDEPTGERAPLRGDLPWWGAPVRAPAAALPPEAGDVGWLLALLADGTPQPLDAVVAASGRSTAEVLRGLVWLELEGAVVRLAGGQVRRR